MSKTFSRYAYKQEEIEREARRKQGADDLKKQRKMIVESGSDIHYLWYSGNRNKRSNKVVCGKLTAFTMGETVVFNEVTCPDCLITSDELTESGLAEVHKEGLLDLTKYALYNGRIKHLCSGCNKKPAEIYGQCKDCRKIAEDEENEDIDDSLSW